MGRGGAIFYPRGIVGRIHKEDHYTLLHTKYESSGSCGFGEDFLMFSHDAPRSVACMDPRGTVGRPLYIATQKYESSGPCGFGEEDCLFFPIVSL